MTAKVFIVQVNCRCHKNKENQGKKNGRTETVAKAANSNTTSIESVSNTPAFFLTSRTRRRSRGSWSGGVKAELMLLMVPLEALVMLVVM